MRIRSITLHGFKSFGNRTTLELSPRVSVIAGPNGSGKSNVVDALRWATGGGRASEFRAGEKTELIFHGAAGKRSVGFAEVEVELERATGRVTVQRSLQRDGSGRLRLNGRNARFIDVDEALSGSGLGRGSLAIIGQGEISSVLMADPGRLLAYVAEAAGVARLAGRFEQAEERLARARDHMDRLQDLHDELQRVLERLGTEAAEASSHAALSRESLLLQFTLAGLRRSALEEELVSLAAEEKRLEQSVAALGSDRATRSEDLSDGRRELASLQENYRQETAAAEAWKGEVRLQESWLQTLTDRIRAGSRQEAALRLEISQLEQASEPEEPPGFTADLQLALEQAQAETARLRSAHESQQAAEQAARELAGALGQQARRHEEEVARWQERQASLTEQLAATEARLSGSEFSRPAGDLEGLARQLAALEETTGAERALQDRLRQQLQSAQEEHAAALGHQQSMETALARLRSAMEARSGFAEGPRIALSSGLPGVIGAVADLLALEETYRNAIAAALGNRSEYIVVQTAEAGQRVIAHVRDAGGFVTVLPLDLLRPRPGRSDSRLQDEPGVLGPATSVISFDDRFTDLFSQLLGGTMLLEDLDSAVRLARRHSERPRLVTLAGEIVDNSGAMSGGRRNANAYLLGQAAELAQLQDDTAAAQEAASAAAARVADLQAQFRASRERLEAALNQQAEVTAALTRSQQEEAVRQRLEQELTERRAGLQASLAALAAEQPVAASDPEQLQAARGAADEAAELTRSTAAELARATAAEAEANAQLRLQRERHSAFEAALERYRTDRQRLERLRSEHADVQQEITGLNSQLEQAATALRTLQARSPQKLDELAAGLQEQQARLKALEERQADAERELLQQQEQLERVRLTLARRETMLQAAVEEAGRFPPGLEALPGSERSLRARLQEVSSQLEQIGPVNHRAAAELEQEQLRAHQLAADLLDAGRAAEELQRSLEEVDAEVSERSEAAISTVSESFVTHVRELFGPEAEAAIETVRHEGRPTGLTIRLQPPGKRTTQLNLLSVGERTMGALAFLFALMDGAGQEGLPIAVLDEVDAPLDEANISRFSTFVARLAERGTQFLLISHQKTTFGVADAMWGVTSDRGVSSVFSISRADTAVALEGAV